MTRNAAVDAKITEFFVDDYPQLQLSFNVIWNGEDAMLDGGVHGIEQIAQIKIGGEPVAGVERTHTMKFELEMVKNRDGDYSVRVRWKVTDAGDMDGPVSAEGVQTLGRVVKASPGSFHSPTVSTTGQSAGRPETVTFLLGNYLGGSGGSMVTIPIPAQRTYIREDGAMVVEAYTIYQTVWVPGSLGGGNENEN